LIEDLLALHIYECGYYHVNGYSSITRRQIRKLKHEERIDELAKIYPNQKTDAITTLISSLHLLRKIRNLVTHAFFPEVGSDFRKEEGVDQIIAMLRSVAKWERFWLKPLEEAHLKVFRGGIEHCWDAFLQRDDPPFDAHVARSKIQEYLDELRTHLKD
jgi:hypothetical protein